MTSTSKCSSEALSSSSRWYAGDCRRNGTPRRTMSMYIARLVWISVPGPAM
ncbi:MAG TPA: hypothetical protein PLI95_10255 [Polyangiaceae bacterium]|nr:hypothetical protein [Polyangiaceae bacterium]